MDNRDDLFRPESVNEQVEQLLCTQDEPGAATVVALQRIYQEDEALLERAWARIASVEAATQTSGNVTNIVSMDHRRKSTMYETDFSSETSDPVMPSSPRPVLSSERPRQARSRVWRTFNLLAATLAAAVIVGSMLLVIGASRSRSTATGSHSTRTNTQTTVSSSPAIYEGGLDELVRADAQTGKVVWRYQVPAKTDPNQMDAFMQILPAGKMVYALVGEAGGPVMAFDAATGRVLWTSQLRDIHSIALTRGTIYVGVNSTNQPPDESYIYALDASTGAQLATQYTLTGSFPRFSVVDGVLYAGTDVSLSAIDPVHHQQIWQKSGADLGLKTNLGAIVGFSIAQGIVYVTLQNSHSSYCMALSASNGDKQWQTPPITETPLGSAGGPDIGTPFASNGMVYFAVIGTSGAVFAYDEHGNQVWSYKTGALLVQSTPVLSGNTLYITEDKIGVGVNAQANLVALDAAGGTVHWQMKPVPGGSLGTTVLNGVVYIATGFAQSANITYAFGASTGASLWQVHLDSDPFTLVSANAN